MRCLVFLAAAARLLGVLGIAVPSEAAPPVILEQPRSQTVGSGETVQFSVIAEGDPPLTYQWRLNGATLDNATNSGLILSNIQPSQAGQYSVLAANSAGTKASEEAFLQVCWEVQLASSEHISLSNGLFAAVSAFNSDGNLYVAQPLPENVGFAVAKLTPTGEQDWEVPFYKTAGFRYLSVRSLAVDFAGNVSVVGVTATNFSSDLEDVLVWKLDSNGAQVWSTGYESAGFPHVTAVDTEGNVYVAGTSSEGTSGRGGAKPPGDIEIVKFSPGGQRLWARTYGGPDNAYDEPGALAADSSGNVYVAGVSGGPPMELVLGKYDTAGNRMWLTRQPYDQMYPPGSVLVDREGNIVVGLSFWHGAPFDTHATLKYDQNGNLLWKVSHSDESDTQAMGARALDQFNNIYFALPRWWDHAGTCTKYDPYGNARWSVARFPHEQISFISYGVAVGIDTEQKVLVAAQAESGGLEVLHYQQNIIPGRPVIHGQPPRRRVASGTTVEFSLVVSGAKPVSYQWRRDGMSLPGATNALLVMSNVTLLDSGNYSLLVTNAVGCSVSAAGLLTVVDVQPFHFEHLEITASQFKFRFVGEAFRVYWFEASTNLVNWAELFGTFSG